MCFMGPGLVWCWHKIHKRPVKVVCVSICLFPPGFLTVWRRTGGSCRASLTGSDWLRPVLTKLKAVKKPQRWKLMHNLQNTAMLIVVWFHCVDKWFSFCVHAGFLKCQVPSPRSSPGLLLYFYWSRWSLLTDSSTTQDTEQTETFWWKILAGKMNTSQL